MVTSQCVSFAFGDLPTLNSLEFTESEKQRLVGRKKKKKTVSFTFYLPLKKEHRAKNKILGELNILSLSISES